MVCHALAQQRPERLEDEWRGDDGRPGIEGEPVLPVDVSAPADIVELTVTR
jgi:hypothetical protein